MFLLGTWDFFLSFLCELSQTVVSHFLFTCQVEELCLTVLSAWWWLLSDAEQPFRGSWSCSYSMCSGAVWWDVLLWSHLTHALTVFCPSHCSGSAHGSYLLSVRYFCVVLKTTTVNIILVSSSFVMQGASQNVWSVLLASIQSSRCFSFWRLKDLHPLSFSSSRFTVGWCWPCLLKPTACTNQRYQQQERECLVFVTQCPRSWLLSHLQCCSVGNISVRNTFNLGSPEAACQHRALLGCPSGTWGKCAVALAGLTPTNY